MNNPKRYADRINRKKEGRKKNKSGFIKPLFEPLVKPLIQPLFESHIKNMYANGKSAEIQAKLEITESKSEKENQTSQQYFYTNSHNGRLQVQAKLEIAPSTDLHEKKADEIGKKISNNENAADLVKNHPEAEVSRQTSLQDDKKAVPELTTDFQNQLQSTKGGGQHLDVNTKTSMEQNMGTDLSGVKIHTDAKANELSENINAKAFTHGQDIYFKQGNYNTESKEGKELLGHELAHTVQQQGGVISGKLIQKQDDKDKLKQKPVESKETVLNRIHQHYGLMIKKYRLDILIDSPVYQDYKDFQLMEDLMEQIESKMILGEFTYTNIVSEGLRYDARIGNNRMVIVDAAENKQAGHQFAIALHGKGLNFHAINRNIIDDKVYEKYSQLKYKQASAKEKKQRKFLSYFWYNNEQLLNLLREDPVNGKELSFNLLTKSKSSGEAVALIQSALQALDKKVQLSKSETDANSFSHSTRTAVVQFQQKHGLPPSGIVDAHTLALLDEELYKIEQQAKNVKDFIKDNQLHEQNKSKDLTGQIRYNKAGNIIYPVPSLSNSLLRQEGIDPEYLKFVYTERKEYVEMLGNGGCRYEVFYKGNYMGVIDVQLDVTYLKDGMERGASLDKGRSNKQYFLNAYSGKYPALYDKIQKGEIFGIAYGLGSKGGDPDFMELLGTYGFKNERGLPSTFEDDAIMGFLDVNTHIEPINMRNTGPKRGQKYGEPKTEGGGKTQQGVKINDAAKQELNIKPSSSIKARTIALKQKLGLKSNFVEIDGVKYDLGAGKKQGKNGAWTEMTEGDILKVEQKLNPQNQKTKSDIEIVPEGVGGANKKFKIYLNGEEIGSGAINEKGNLGLDLNIREDLQNQGIGHNVISELIEQNKGTNFEVKTITGRWIRDSKYKNGISVNLKIFIESYIDQNLSFQEAAFSTPTGKIAKRLGFEKVTMIDIEGVENPSNNKYFSIYFAEVKFSKK